MPGNDHESLDRLISEADRQVAARNRKASAGKRTVNPASAAIFALVTVVVGFASGWRHMQGVEQQHVRRDLLQVIESARQSVESARGASGHLPLAMPNAALSSVVRYSPQGERYSLSTYSHGLVAIMDADGSTRIEGRYQK